MREQVAVLTPHLVEREEMLAKAERSVERQSYGPIVHLIDSTPGHPGSIRNQLIGRARDLGANWVAFLDDDDWFLAHHIETLIAAASESDADVVYPQWRFPSGRVGWAKPWDGTEMIATTTHFENWIPVTVLARTDAILAVGGFPEAVAEDWELWKKLALAGAKFTFVDEVTWIYRTSRY